MVVALACAILGMYCDLWLLSRELNRKSLSDEGPVPFTTDLGRAVTTCVSPTLNLFKKTDAL